MGMLSSYADRLYSHHEIVPLVWLKVAAFVTDAAEHYELSARLIDQKEFAELYRVCVRNVYDKQSGFLQSDEIWLLLLPLSTLKG